MTDHEGHAALCQIARSWRKDANGAQALGQSDDAARFGPLLADAIEDLTAKLAEAKRLVAALDRTARSLPADDFGDHAVINSQGWAELCDLLLSEGDDR